MHVSSPPIVRSSSAWISRTSPLPAGRTSLDRCSLARTLEGLVRDRPISRSSIVAAPHSCLDIDWQPRCSVPLDVDVPVDLPVSSAEPKKKPDKPLYLTVKEDLTLALGNDAVPRSQIAFALDDATEADRLQRVFLRADKTVPYGELMEVMNLLRAAGYLKVALAGLEGTAVGQGQAAP